MKSIQLKYFSKYKGIHFQVSMKHVEKQPELTQVPKINWDSPPLPFHKHNQIHVENV